MVTLLLPRYHRDTLEVLLVFLKWVASFAHVDEETGSKMDLGNLATVITPSILKANRRDGARDESFPAIRVVTELLEEQEELLLAPEEFLPILQNQNYFTATLDQPRELLKKIDTFLRLRYGSSSGSSGQFGPSAYPSRGSAPSPAFYTPSPSSSRSNQELYGPPPGVNGVHPVDRLGPAGLPAEYNGKSLPPHPGLPHQPFSSPHSTSRLQEPTNPRPSLDNFWAPPPVPNSDPRRESPNSRPSSYLKPSSDSSPVFGTASPSRNSPLGA
jgi:RhoGAP domain